MRKSDKIKELNKLNILVESRYLNSKELIKENEDPNNFTLKFIKDFETPISIRDGFGKIIMRQVFEVVKAAGEQGLNINDLWKNEEFKYVTAMKPNILHWISQMIDKGYLAKY